MKIFIIALLITLLATESFARGGFSSGGMRGGFSSSRSSYSSRSYGSRSYSSPRSVTRTVSRTSSYHPSYGYHPMMYPGFGMGYGYYGNNGLLTGLIIGSMMHPANTVVYTGGGYSGGQALLYPDGRVVNQQGYEVGTYQNGQFTAVENGAMVAQPAPQDTTVTDNSGEILVTVFLAIGLIIAVAVLFVLII